MVLGLLGSLGRPPAPALAADHPGVRPAIRPSPTVVAVGGLARSDSGNFTAEFAVARCERLAKPRRARLRSRTRRCGKGVTVAVINGSMAHLSDTLFTTAIAVYALAMVSYTAEYAFGRRGRIAATSRADAGARSWSAPAPAGPAGTDRLPRR